MDGATTIPKPADRVAWLDARAPYVGASDAACLLGVHPYKTLGELAAEKLTGNRQPENAAMRRGQRLEAAVALWYSDELGLALEEPDVMYVDASGSLCATLDRRVVGADVAVEVKTTAGYVREPLPHWVVQAQAQMLCAELERVELAVLDATLDLSVYPVEPDPELMADLVERAGAFLEGVRSGVFPPDATLDYGTAKLLHPDADPEAVAELDGEAMGLLGMLATVTRRIKGLEAEASILRGMVGHRLATASEGRYGGVRVCTWREESRRYIDAKRLRAEHPEIAEAYTVTTTPARVLRVLS